MSKWEIRRWFTSSFTASNRLKDKTCVHLQFCIHTLTFSLLPARASFSLFSFLGWHYCIDDSFAEERKNVTISSLQTNKMHIFFNGHICAFMTLPSSSAWRKHYQRVWRHLVEDKRTVLQEGGKLSCQDHCGNQLVNHSFHY